MLPVVAGILADMMMTSDSIVVVLEDTGTCETSIYKKISTKQLLFKDKDAVMANLRVVSGCWNIGRYDDDIRFHSSCLGRYRNL